MLDKMSSEIEIEYGEIRGILSTFSTFNNKKWNNYEFNFIKKEKDNSLKSLVKSYFSIDESNYELHKVEDWKTLMEDSLNYFLFQCFHDKYEANLYDSGGIFSLLSPSFQQQYIKTIVDKIEKVSFPNIVWNIRFNSLSKGDFWDGFIIEGLHSNYLLILKWYFGLYDFLQGKQV